MAVPAGCLRLLWICESKIVQVEFIMPYPMWWACALHGHLPVPVPHFLRPLGLRLAPRTTRLPPPQSPHPLGQRSAGKPPTSGPAG